MISRITGPSVPPVEIQRHCRESIGGGGNGGFAIAATATVSDAKGSAQAIGGKGSSGNTSGDVHVTNVGNITTVKDLSFGILAQSIGGGGGNGGFALAGSLSTSGQAVTNATGGDGGGGNAAGNLLVKSDGTIITTGNGPAPSLRNRLAAVAAPAAFRAALRLGSAVTAPPTPWAARAARDPTPGRSRLIRAIGCRVVDTNDR